MLNFNSIFGQSHENICMCLYHILFHLFQAKSRMVEKLVPAGGTEKCGFAGWNRCTSGTQTKM